MKTQKKPPSLRSMISVVGLLALQSGLSLSAFAEGGATGVGGGGDASEVRVNEIRVDILKWIAEGGDQGLKMPAGLAPKQYRDGMNAVLAQNQVVVAFKAEPVIVYGTEKTCRGFESPTDRRLHIECNIARFKTTSDSDQYKLVHHEYAGLAGLERNDGAASDYSLSSQVTEYLVRETVMKLAIHRVVPDPTQAIHVTCPLLDPKDPTSPVSKGSPWSISFVNSGSNQSGRVYPTDREGSLTLTQLSQAPSRLHPNHIVYQTAFEFETTPNEDQSSGGWHSKYKYAMTFYINLRSPSQSQYEIRSLEKNYGGSWLDLFGPTTTQKTSSGWQPVQCRID